MQNHVVDMLLTDLRHLILDLGKDGGLIGPSIYDTAQVVRLAPPSSDVRPALEWLIAQQQPVATDLRVLISTIHLAADL